MTDLEKMNVDEIRKWYTCDGVQNVVHIEAFDEMARRLRELEKEYEGRRIQLGVCSIERTAEWKRAEQAESALLACQAREGELREALQHERFCRICCEDGCSNCPDCTAEQALSHSTGSKIMAVIEAVKGHYEWHQEHDPKTTCAICEKYRALEAKHE